MPRPKKSTGTKPNIDSTKLYTFISLEPEFEFLKLSNLDIIEGWIKIVRKYCSNILLITFCGRHLLKNELFIK